MDNNIIIGIDASRLTVEQKTGIEEYASKLIEHLVKIYPETQFRLYVQKRPKESFGKNAEFIVLPDKKFWTQTRLARELRTNPPDVFFSPVYTLPRHHPKASVVTIHGLEFIKTPESYSRWHRMYHHQITKYSVKHAGHIICVSENTKNDLVEYYHADPSKISVVFNGITHTITPQKPSPVPTILYISRLEKRKNVATIVQAFSQFKHATQSNAKLILAGSWGTIGTEEIKKAINASPFKNDIITTGYVTSHQKEQLLSQAHLFVFPSLYEGFGLPVLEAMDAGVPVITSATSSLPEVGGDCVEYVNPNDFHALAQTMEKILQQEQRQEEMSRNGKTRAQLFSWERCAKETYNILHSTAMRHAKNDKPSL